MLIYANCAKCNTPIEIGQTCYEVDSKPYCSDCCKQVDTQAVFDLVSIYNLANSNVVPQRVISQMILELAHRYNKENK